MNKKLLNTGVQNFISKKLNADIMSVLLKKSDFEGISPKELAQQIEAKKKCREKLPTWFKTPKIYYPKKLNIEQASSETTAEYKAKIVGGKSLLDLTGGFGVDSYFFSKKVDQGFHVEIDEDLSEIASNNFGVLGAENIKTIVSDGIDFLRSFQNKFDWIYVDPSRRNDVKGKVFMLSDCLPNVPTHLDLLFSKSNNILIKTSPLLDLSVGIKELQFVKKIHVVAVNNEVKELLWELGKDFEDDVSVKAINLKKDSQEIFNFNLSEEKNAVSSFSEPLKYLFEPNAAIMKSGAFKVLGDRFSLKKLHEHTHLYTSEELFDFPGRRFKIERVQPFNKKDIKKIGIKKANIATRNFPESVASIRKKFGIKDGGNLYLFFVKNNMDRLMVLQCKRIP